HLWASRAGPEGSHRPMPMAAADAIAIVPEGGGDLRHGGRVEIVPFLRCWPTEAMP
ncbi:hypothetical protein KC219_24150, partial [Mycobacterium tuberculosis]|nr:hypothetical protein [Mycobacterium tuberculosis]